MKIPGFAKHCEEWRHRETEKDVFMTFMMVGSGNRGWMAVFWIGATIWSYDEYRLVSAIQAKE